MKSLNSLCISVSLIAIFICFTQDQIETKHFGSAVSKYSRLSMLIATCHMTITLVKEIT